MPSNFKASLLGKEPLPVPTAKDFAVVIDSTLSFDEHATHAVSKYISQDIAKSIARNMHQAERFELLTLRL